VIIVIALIFGINPMSLLQVGEAVAPAPPAGEAGPPPADDEAGQFVAAVLGSTEVAWNDIFAQSGQQYPEPTLVMFSDAVRSACGFAQAAVGPFYCPPDRQVYIDLSFFRDLRQRFGAPGEFAQAYVIAHEVGHHVQNVLGIADQVNRAGQGRGQAEVNQLSVMQELQADCFAGVWAHHADAMQALVERGDIDDALRAAAAIGDDRLQRQAGGYISPESFTHGTSEQRARWFRTGYEHGNVERCDTFSATRL
jgi:predicted metalloprotease